MKTRNKTHRTEATVTAPTPTVKILTQLSTDNGS